MFCSKCGKQLSDNAASCPDCDVPIKVRKHRKKISLLFAVLIWAGSLASLSVAFAVFHSQEMNEAKIEIEKIKKEITQMKSMEKEKIRKTARKTYINTITEIGDGFGLSTVTNEQKEILYDSYPMSENWYQENCCY